MAEEKVALVLAGGVALGAYQVGAYEAMPKALRRRLSWIAGSSIGAVNGAILASNAPGSRREALARFWDGLARENSALVPGMLRDGVWARPFSWLNVAATRVFGRGSLFSPLIPPLRPDSLGLYRLDGMRSALRQHVDFDRINGGDIRLSISATDLATGDWVTFDTGRGDRIGEDQILASCGFLPDFEPTEVDGRLLGDGALAANAPLEAVIEAAEDGQDLTVFVIDLFARDLGPPHGMVDALELRLDLLLSSPTHRALDLVERNDALRRHIATLLDRLPAKDRKDPQLAEAERAARRSALRIRHLSYRAGPAEAGAEKQFDFSRASIDRRREAGRADMVAALNHSDADAGGWQRLTVRRAPEA